MNKTNKFSLDVRERAVRLVQERRGEYPLRFAYVESTTPKIGSTPQALPDWVKRDEVDGGQRDGLTTSERNRLKQLERANKERRAPTIF